MTGTLAFVIAQSQGVVVHGDLAVLQDVRGVVVFAHAQRQQPPQPTQLRQSPPPHRRGATRRGDAVRRIDFRPPRSAVNVAGTDSGSDGTVTGAVVLAGGAHPVFGSEGAQRVEMPLRWQ